MTQNETFEDLIHRVALLSRFESLACYDFVDKCIVDFVSDFVMRLKTVRVGSYRVQRYFVESTYFVKAIHYVMEHGGEKELHAFGEWAITDESIFSALLKATMDASNAMTPQIFMHDILTKSLIQHSVTEKHNWIYHRNKSGSVPPSIHVQHVLEAYPDIVQCTDKDGRLTLHHAVDSTNAPYEMIMDIFDANPKSASVCDPVSGLYPFMIAASNDNIAASFSLLLADPNLVIGGIQMDDTNKKRKRSPSMSDTIGL
mmetsp:Transcript_38629/g.81227  ORF Transcript_38629/g.81227 Transcript_38629/m.81227 type:complete len:257 (+) Transcript_38629:526-1296(+)